MSFGMRVRLWWSRASAGERVTGLAVVLVAAALLAYGLVPVGSHNHPAAQSEIAVRGSQAGSVSSATGAAAAGHTAATGGGPAGTSTSSQNAAAARASDGPGSALAGTALAGPQQSSGGAVTGASGSNQSGTILTASDQGVTAKTIKVGFLIANTGGLSGSGFVLGLRTDMASVIKAYVDWVNKHGGVDGRTLTYVTEGVDPLNSSNQESACINMTEDQRVFAVLDSATTLGAQELCYGAQHHEPYFNTGLSTVSAAYVAQSFPYQVSTAEDGTRQVTNWADYAESLGLFKGKKLGILDDDCAPDPDIVGTATSVLGRFGVKPVVVTLSCDTSTAQQQIPSAVLQMRQAGVTLVLPATIFTNVQVFLEDAQAQAWFPKYTASDFYGMSIDLFTENFPPSEWSATEAVTASLDYQGSFAHPNAPVIACNQALAAENVPPIQNYDADSEALVQCDAVHLLVAALEKDWPNPTRLGWADAVQGLGAFPSAFAAAADFRPGKTEGGDLLGLTTWTSNCKCYVLTSPINRPAYA